MTLRNIELLGSPVSFSGSPSTPIARDVISPRLLEGFQRNLAQIFITRVDTGEKVFEMRGQGHIETKCTSAAKVYISTV